jgi:hypothetical protein
LPFDEQRLVEVGRRVRALFPASNAERVRDRAGDAFLQALARKVTTGFGGKVSVAPRTFLRELVDILDRVDQHAEYDPATQYELRLDEAALSAQELEALHGPAPDEETGEPRKPRRLDG